MSVLGTLGQSQCFPAILRLPFSLPVLRSLSLYNTLHLSILPIMASQVAVRSSQPTTTSSPNLSSLGLFPPPQLGWIAQNATPEQQKSFQVLAEAKTPQEVADAGVEVLHCVADRVSDLEIQAGVIWGYVRQHCFLPRLSQSSTSTTVVAPPPLRQTEEEYLAQLGEATRNIVVRSAETVRAQEAAINTIRKHWGDKWFDRIPKDLLAEDAQGHPQFLSRRLLQKIAEVSKTTTQLDRAVEGMQAAVELRIDPEERRKTNSKASRLRQLQIRDVTRFLDDFRRDGKADHLRLRRSDAEESEQALASRQTVSATSLYIHIHL